MKRLIPAALAALTLCAGPAQAGTVSGVSGTLDVSIVGNGGQYPVPVGAIPLAATSGVIANTAGTVNLPAVAGKTTYMTGLTVTGLGATAASSVSMTVFLAGTSTTLYYVIPVPAGATVGLPVFNLIFPTPLSAGAVNSVIQTILPALGAGNTAAALTVYGYQL